MSKKRILVVEDEKNINELIKFNLESSGYDVSSAFDGEEGLNKLREAHVDLILLDLMLPKVDGIEVCKIVRQNSKTAHIPIVMLTAKSEETDIVLGLELGADDYVTKPFSPKELLARVKAVFRRSSGTNPTNEVFSIGELKVDFAKHQVWLGKDHIVLTSKEYDLLKVLVESKGRALTREYLLDKVWGYEDAMRIETRTVDMHIGQLRKKLKPEAHRILTIKNVGYRFESEDE